MLAIAGQTAELNWLKFFMKLMDIHPKAKKLIFFKMWIFFSNVRVKLFNALFWKKCLNSNCTSTKVFIYTFKKKIWEFFFNNCSCFFLTKSKLDFLYLVMKLVQDLQFLTVLTVEIWDIRLGTYQVNAVLLKVRPQTVSVQAKPVRYPIQPGHNPPGSKCHTRTQASATYSALNLSLPYNKVWAQFGCFNETKLLYTVMKAEFWF